MNEKMTGRMAEMKQARANASHENLSAEHSKFLKACHALLQKKASTGKASADNQAQGLARLQELLVAELLASDLTRIDKPIFMRDAEALFALGKKLAKTPAPPRLADARAATSFIAGSSQSRDDGFSFLLAHENMPFLASSLSNYFARESIMVQRFLHISVPRSLFLRDGKDATTVTSGTSAGTTLGTSAGTNSGDIATVLLQCHGDDNPQRRATIVSGVNAVCARNRAAVSDWQKMRSELERHAQNLQESFACDLASSSRANPTLERQEAIDLLQWVLDENMTFLGLSYMGSEAEEAKAASSGNEKFDEIGLGIFNEQGMAVLSRDGSSADVLFSSASVFSDFRKSPESVAILKADRHSLVHRDVPLDVLLSKGISSSVLVLAGLFTSKGAYAPLESVPILRRQLRAVGARLGVVARSQKARHVRNLLQLYPRALLWQAPLDILCEHVDDMREAQQRGSVKLLLLRTQDKISAIVCMAKQNYGVGLERVFARILARHFNAPVDTEGAMIGEDALARVHFIIDTPALPPPSGAGSKQAIEALLANAARSIEERIAAALDKSFPLAEREALLKRYAQAFPAPYWEEIQDHEHDEKAADEIIEDNNLIEDLLLCEESFARDDGVALALSRKTRRPEHIFGSTGEALAGKTVAGKTVADQTEDEAEDEEFFSLALSIRDGLSLSDLVPILESLGFKTITETPHSITPTIDGKQRHTTLYHVRLASRAKPAHIEDLPQRFASCFRRVQKGLLPSDTFNSLILLTRLNWREIALLRALTRYLRQAAVPFSQTLISQATTRYPDLAEALVSLFCARLDPELQERARTKAMEDCEKGIEELLLTVKTREDDRIVRLLWQTIAAIARSNYFHDEQASSLKLAEIESGFCLSFKFFSDRLEFLPSPRPWREIFVSASDFEAVHLRFGPVARGGLRWSDRQHDFRTEILGLVKAQRVKNAVIVPVGAKGGFVVKNPATEPSLRQKQGIACYQGFITAMLAISDNLHDDKVVAPKRTKRWDDDDPYLVVAADKGTASFSDIANEIAIARGYWLQDAFASGGSQGYDHKQMGITSRGVWECVAAHFREMRGYAWNSEPFDVVGVGDMAGDVFGNGMLGSEQIRLLAAFNHKHIFIDPQPDPAKSYKERLRLFKNPPQAGWDNYDSSLISAGGGLFLRSAKTIELTKEIRQLFGISQTSIAPDELIRLILQLDVELLWFGGIGTFIKSARENDADIGDHANDSTRVVGSSLRAKIIGEGANLGATQAGRVEYALAGGRCNMDAIDNSAGVDCSDHEVNIKILLALAERAGELNKARRLELLKAMTDDIAVSVLHHNYRQSQALSMMESLGLRNIERQRLLIRDLVREAGLERKLEELPNEEEIDRRRDEKKALTRPELSVLLCYTKNALYERILESDLPNDPRLFPLLRDYFPDKLRKDFLQYIEKHPLRREIIATRLTSITIDHLGASFLAEIRRETGASFVDIARANFIVMNLFSLPSLWARIDKLDDKVAAARATRMRYESQRLLFRLDAWFLYRSSDLSVDLSSIEKVETRFAAKIAALSKLPSHLPPYFKAEAKERAELFKSHAGDLDDATALVEELSLLKLRSTFCDIALLSDKNDIDAVFAGVCYYSISEKFGFDILRTSLDRMQDSADPWQQLALANAIDDLWGAQWFFTDHALAGLAKSKNSDSRKGGEKIDEWYAANEACFRRLTPLLQEARGSLRLPMVMVLMLAFHKARSNLASNSVKQKKGR